MKKIAISLIAGAATLAVAAPTIAQDRAPEHNGPRAELTRAAVQERTQKAFARMDANGDGKVDTADREARRKAMFDRVDADNNGQLSFAEFSAHHGDRQQGERAERAGKRGERMSHRGHRGPGMAMRGAGGMGRGADGNNDGAITLAELETAALARFDSVDADKNGVVTAAERKAQRDAMRQQMQQRRAQRAG